MNLHSEIEYLANTIKHKAVKMPHLKYLWPMISELNKKCDQLSEMRGQPVYSCDYVDWPTLLEGNGNV